VARKELREAIFDGTVSQSSAQNAALRKEDWNFSELFQAPRATLVGACYYEYARESEQVRRTMRLLLRLQKEAENRGLGRFLGLRSVEHEIQTIEARGGVGAPRLGTLAKYLAVDSPWLLIPAEDRTRAIESAFKNRYEVPIGADGMRAFHAKLGFQPIEWCDFVAPQFKEEQVSRNEDLYHREITRDGRLEPLRSAGDEVLPVLIRWGQFRDEQIVEDFRAWVKNNRPKKWKDLAKGSGHSRANWWVAALKELSAMRLSHVYPPRKARELFMEAYTTGENLDEKALAKSRRNAMKTFAHLFPFKGEKPRHGLTLRARRPQVTKTRPF
jgi:hypothetical protein